MKKRILSILLTVLLILSIVPLNIAFAQAIGDVNGDGNITAADARIALRASVGLENLTDEQKKAADVDSTPGVTAADARLILRASVGLENLHTHAYTDKVTTEPTCTKNGVKTFTCECGDSYTENIPAKGHTEVKDAAVAPTCTKTGKTEGSHCSVCKTVLKAQTDVAANGHKEVKIPAVAATCTKTGLTEGKKCSVCDTITKVQQTVKATGHIKSTLDKSTVVAPTCVKDGYSGDYKCNVCKAITKKGKTVASDGTKHSMVSTTIPASCTQDGYTADKCEYCEYFDPDTYVAGGAATGHSWGKKTTVAPTCTEQGYSLEICTVCKADSKSDYVDAKGHDYTWNITKQATCKATGSRTGTCKVCGDKTTEVIGIQPCTPSAKTERVKGSKENNISCKEVIKCTVCEKIISEAETDNAHITTQSNATVATCTTDGTKDLACRYCNYTKHVISEAAKGHTNSSAERKDATCTEPGWVMISGECTVCHTVLESQTIELKATGHNPTGVQSCTTSVTCTKCPEVIAPALGHDFTVHSKAYSADVSTFFCERCGAKTSDELAAFNNIVNKIATPAFYNGESCPHFGDYNYNLQQLEKTHISTTYSRFDFGIYTSAIRSLYEDEMANNPDDYARVSSRYIQVQLPLDADRNAVSLLTKNDIDSITTEKLSSIKIGDVISDYNTTFTVGSKEYNIQKFKDVTVNDVIKVTVDVKNEKYSQVKNLDKNELTSLQKIYDVNIRNEIAGYETDNNGNLVMTETDKGEGYEISMTMLLREITSDAKITYYLKADTLEPVIALYNTGLTMDQTIDMTFKIGMFSLNGELDPIITTNYSRVYLFTNFFSQY